MSIVAIAIKKKSRKIITPWVCFIFQFVSRYIISFDPHDPVIEVRQDITPKGRYTMILNFKLPHFHEASRDRL